MLPRMKWRWWEENNRISFSSWWLFQINIEGMRIRTITNLLAFENHQDKTHRFTDEYKHGIECVNLRRSQNDQRYELKWHWRSVQVDLSMNNELKPTKDHRVMITIISDEPRSFSILVPMLAWNMRCRSDVTLRKSRQVLIAMLSSFVGLDSRIQHGYASDSDVFMNQMHSWQSEPMLISNNEWMTNDQGKSRVLVNDDESACWLFRSLARRCGQTILTDVVDVWRWICSATRFLRPESIVLRFFPAMICFQWYFIEFVPVGYVARKWLMVQREKLFIDDGKWSDDSPVWWSR